MAKMRLSNNVNKADVEEAHRLFNVIFFYNLS